MEYYSAIKRDTFESVLTRWMNLEPIIQSEVSQKEKEKYCTLMNIYMEFRKMVPMVLHFMAARETQVYRFGLIGEDKNG